MTNGETMAILSVDAAWTTTEPSGVALLVGTETGYPIALIRESPGAVPRTIETYPHPALLRLLDRDHRVPYKVGKSSKYWPRASRPQRIANLLAEFEAIRDGLSAGLAGVHLHLPLPSVASTLSELKKYEDSLDALVSGWVGVRYTQERARAYGDDTSAIWVPE